MPVPKKKKAAHKNNASSRKAVTSGPVLAKTDQPSQKEVDKPIRVATSIVDRPTTEILPVELTKEEINIYAKESARLHGDVAKLEQQKKDVSAEYKARIGGFETRIAELNRKIESGREDRNVECFWRIDYKAGTKTLHRRLDDNGKTEEIKTYPLTPDERQPRLPLAETANDRVAQPSLLKEGALNGEADDAIAEWFDALGKDERFKLINGPEVTSDLLEKPLHELGPTDSGVVHRIWKQRPPEATKAAE